MAYVDILALVLVGVVVSVVSERHSLYYIYSALNKDVALPGIYEFTALGLLDDREIDYYNSKEQVKIPKQDWMKEKMEDEYWVKGTQSRKSKEQWFRVNVGILMERMRHNDSDLHVLQWRHGCEIDDSRGAVKFVKGIDEYSYDGSEFLSFDDENMRWIAPVPEATPTKQKWDGVAILNQYTKGYLEKECVDWLTKFMDYGKQSLEKHSKPDVRAFAKKSVSDPEKLTLTCMATGFYPKDVTMCVRKFKTSLPEHLLTSSGVRPNDDGTYQLRKSVEIPEGDAAVYDCYVTHSSLKEPLITEWDHKCSDCKPGAMIAVGIVIGGLIALVIGATVFLIKKRGKKVCAGSEQSSSAVNQPSIAVGSAGSGQSSPAVNQLSVAVDPVSSTPLMQPAHNDSDSGRESGGSSHGSAENVKAAANGQPRQEERKALLNPPA
ncbi:zinc-alpha-2-glycoprotein-like [Salminus brasiliensis]|uniref:zinc-alpha-2-glycoprotein-like n=1 Tax=Salminus brasiliensis TaxID=930266 RepID=UPI003B82FA9A